MWYTFKESSEAALAELIDAPDRTVGIVAAAMVESYLTDALKKELHKDDTDFTNHVRANLFNPDGALGPFAAKIKLAYLMGYLTPEGYDDLQNIKNIRNLFAHYMEHGSFSAQRIKDRCTNFKLVDKRVRKPMMRARSGEGDWIEREGLSIASNTVFLNLRDAEQVVKEPKGRFVAMAKLFVAAFELYASTGKPLKKPIV